MFWDELTTTYLRAYYLIIKLDKQEYVHMQQIFIVVSIFILSSFYCC